MCTNWSQCWLTGSAYIGSDKEPQDFDYVEFVHAEDKERHEAAMNIVHLSNFNTVAGNIMQEFLDEH